MVDDLNGNKNLASWAKRLCSETFENNEEFSKVLYQEAIDVAVGSKGGAFLPCCGCTYC